MTDTTADILLLSLGVVGILMALTFFGEVLRARVPEGETSQAVETFVTRVQSWWGMVILLSLALLSGRVGVILLFAFASFAALREVLTFTHKTRADHLSLALGFFVVLPLQYLFVGLEWTTLFTIMIPVLGFLMLPVLSALRGAPDRFLVRVAETQWGLMICVYCASHIPALMTLEAPGYEDRSILLIVFFVMVVQFGDLLEYFWGRKFGKRRIAPGLSPKTWEGVAFGIAMASVIGGLLNWITPFGFLGAAAMAAAASTTGMLGNLVFAAIKRDRGVKDWSHLIPGQGGFMDQLDSVVFAAPVFFHLTALLWMS